MCLRSIVNGLPDEENGSRLLLAQALVDYVHKMRFLDATKSRQLFSKTIFSGNTLKGENQFPTEFKSMARQLLAECGGLPLAIKYVGRQLAEKRQAGSEWEHILESFDFDAILVSCFLRLAFFKQNTTVRTEKLMILTWAAGGIASEEEITQSLHQMVKELIVEVNDFPIKRFCVNPLLHKLSTKKAVEELGFQIARNNVTSRSSQTPLHRAIYCSRDRLVYSDNHDKLFVSLFFRGDGHLDASPSYWQNFQLLKILDLEDFGIKILPESIGTKILGIEKQLHTRAATVVGVLEDLDIALNCMVEVPDIIWEMSSLRRLYMTNIIFREPLFLFVLGVESLTYVSAENWTCAEWWPLTTKLRKLGIEIEESSNIGGILFALSNKMKELNYLSLRGSRFKSMPTDGIPSCLVTLKLDGRLAGLSNMPL
ncbi:probable disease resistance protein At1g58390 [Salvia splendens]|uniref:probable disease resistance protein At1g58390 n=1 Tax=Salvia splendens TaxID=180675 RepID=UPI001C26E9D1|nr:probable disease resistance protein At1g58390 [Salvia splendens]XP_042031924.1 probable disease resistance protein At1g58390 [Salvia splendens]XP_042031925.1 probable disease resistance protein At1g58390 [Salvia splendens]